MGKSDPINWPKLLKSWVLIALGVLVAAATSDGIQYSNGWSLFIAVVLISLFNVILRPVLIFLALPFVVLTFGLGIFLINALLFMLVGAIVPGFDVASFWSALWGAVVVAFVSLLANLLLGSTKVQVHRTGPGQGGPQMRHRVDKKDDDVIDI